MSWRTRSVEALPGATLPELSELSELLILELIRTKQTIAVAESCTAGALASSLARAEGAGDALIGGFVTYTPMAKTRILAVPTKLIEAHSAVSGPVAQAMAKGVLAHTAAALALAVTGVTGATPDDRGNPRGRVFIAAARQNGEGIECHCEFGPFPPLVLLDAALRTAIALGLDALKSH
ncbi:CinA family protein [Bosea sp. NPDC055332]